MIDNSIRKLVCYGLEKGLFTKRDEIYVTNRLLEILKLDSFDCNEKYTNVNLEQTLKELLENGETFNLGAGVKSVTIIYSMPESVGNESKGATADFYIDVTAKATDAK